MQPLPRCVFVAVVVLPPAFDFVLDASATVRLATGYSSCIFPAQGLRLRLPVSREKLYDAKKEEKPTKKQWHKGVCDQHREGYRMKTRITERTKFEVSTVSTPQPKRPCSLDVFVSACSSAVILSCSLVTFCPSTVRRVSGVGMCECENR